jgi:hypothetical protein
MAARYSQKERIIAKYLSAFPGAKQFLKKTYQWVNYLIYKPNYEFRSDFKIEFVDATNGETFFGYYDKSPESPCGQYLLYHLSQRNTNKIPSGSEPIEVICIRIDNGKIIYKNKTKAYNWQQGARLHWIKENTFAYNMFGPGEGYGAMVVFLKENAISEELKLSKPIYDSCASFALSLNFEKLHNLRPDYGYRCHDPSMNLSDPEEGIFISRNFDNDWKLILSLKSINQEFPVLLGRREIEVPFAAQKFNHIMISPDEKNIVFLHRFYVEGKRIDRLFCYYLSNEQLKLLNQDEMVSHYCWLNATQLMVYMRDDSTAGDNYYIIDVCSGEIKTLETLIDRFGDGHPTANAKEIVVFDTYPNKSRMKELFQIDLRSQQVSKLGEFLEPMSFYGETRCDLHPRFNYTGNKVYFDSVHSGKRSLYWININE